MSVRTYDELTPAEQDKLSQAWLDIVKGIKVYAQITNAAALDDMVNEAIWEEVRLQKVEEELMK